MALTITRNGYGQVEMNHVAAKQTGQIYASLPLDNEVDVLQNGEFMYYDETVGKVTGASTLVKEPYMVFNEEKIYSDYGTRKNFALIRHGDNYFTEDPFLGANPAVPVSPTTIRPQNSGYRLDGFAPRLYKINIGDTFTTNMVTLASYEVGDKLVPTYNSNSKTLVLTAVGSTTPAAGLPIFVVVKETTMPDGQPGLKLTRVE